MPTPEQHSIQYAKNKGFLKTLNDGPFDWLVTVAFYCAVHLVEKKLAINGEHFLDHTKRKQHLNGKMEFDGFYNQYISLYRESRAARYDCQSFNRKRALDAIDLLKHIEETI